jgi:pilus assembly protein Flp/PilA
MEAPGSGCDRTIRTISSILSHLAQDESGQDLVEYALVAALVALGAVASIRSLGTRVASTFTAVTASLSSSI